jgi:hypothetical protein
MTFKKLVVLASLLVAAPAAWAQDPRVELGAVGAWNLSDGVTSEGAIRGGDGQLYNGIGPKDSFGYSLNLGYFTTEQVEVGALFSHQLSKMEITGTATRELGSWNVMNYHGYIAYNSGDFASKTRGYFLFGLGATSYSGVDFTTVAGQPRSIGGETKFSTTWGLGVKVYPSEKAGLKLGVRWTPTYIKSDAAGWWCDPYWGCYVVGDAQYSNQFEFSAGFTIRF